MHHLTQLVGDQLINLGDAGIDVGRQVLGHHHGAAQHFLDELANDVLGAGMLGVGLGDLALGNDVVQQADAVSNCAGLRLELCAHGLTPGLAELERPTS